MIKSIAVYGALLAAVALLLRLIEYKYIVHAYSTELYIGIIAVVFTGLGVLAGRSLRNANATNDFTPNDEARRYLGISDRELEVLELLAEGGSNIDIAEKLSVSTNTVKTHLSHIYQKFDVRRRTQAVKKARNLQLIR